MKQISLEEVKIVHAEEWLCPECRFPNLFDGGDKGKLHSEVCWVSEIFWGEEMKLNKQDLLNLVCGRPVPYGNNPYTKFTGNQWNEAWEWDRSKLEKLTDDELYALYFGVKK